ncbi:sigma-54 dependent transcriptional regulator [Brevibacillus sp. WF146]|uniref:sigma-54-dependent transcriptional regulator n=1 Tax=Brevibacillus sp. WF146 TaxID=319501 RepID=UPI000B2BE2DF|nr:sigma-54 dependent transcriptional regulator [Brevibacillus sp. WF146]UYZ12622.1 sigma-54 dependent transcriptional regulator [Brevibacillus sp. WF146]
MMTNKPNVLILDDESTICKSLSFVLEDDYQVYTATDPEEAYVLVTRVTFAFALIDLRLGIHDGIDVLKRVKQLSPKTVVMIMTAYGSIPSALQAMRSGAFTYISKPIDMEELKVLAAKALEQYQLQHRVEWLNEEIQKVYDVHGLIGQSVPMRQVFSLIEKVKNIDSNVLITGESGTGKELVARAIHFSGTRREKGFYAINCAAIPAHLMESELFGYEKGAFTGATSRKPGIIELAEGGTLFLDEIGELDLALQSKLLRVIQEKKVTPVGGQQEKSVDVRIICATNKDLKKEVQNGSFREDLYYRLNVIQITMPPLRERREDIPLLVRHLIQKFNKKMSKQIKEIAPDALELLLSYSYPGNVRELQNIIERSIALSDSDTITVKDLPSDLREETSYAVDDNKLIPVFVGETMEQVERKVIMATLQAMDGNRRRTADVLGIGERTLRDKLKKYRKE